MHAVLCPAECLRLCFLCGLNVLLSHSRLPTTTLVTCMHVGRAGFFSQQSTQGCLDQSRACPFKAFILASVQHCHRAPAMVCHIGCHRPQQHLHQPPRHVAAQDHLRADRRGHADRQTSRYCVVRWPSQVVWGQCRPSVQTAAMHHTAFGWAGSSTRAPTAAACRSSARWQMASPTPATLSSVGSTMMCTSYCTPAACSTGRYGRECHGWWGSSRLIHSASMQAHSSGCRRSGCCCCSPPSKPPLAGRQAHLQPRLKAVLHTVLCSGLESFYGWVCVKCHAIDCRPAIARPAGQVWQAGGQQQSSAHGEQGAGARGWAAGPEPAPPAAAEPQGCTALPWLGAGTHR